MNFYEILELSENEINSQNIKKQIDEKKKIWNIWRNQGTPKQQELAKEYMANISEIEKIISDKDLREKHRKEFINKNKEKQKKAFEELDDIIKVLSNPISKKQFDEIIKQFKNIFNENEIKNRLNKSGINIKSTNSKSPKNTKKSKLEASKMKEIVNKLELLNKKDLYDFLSLSKNSSLKSLQNRAEEILQETRGKTDPENSRKAKLAGEAKAIYSSSLNKEKYDNSLSSLHLTKLDKTINVVLANKVLREDNIPQLIKVANKYNISEAEAIEYIKEFANKRKCTIIGEFKNIDIKSCVFCGEIIDKEKRCPGCGELVIQKCPICKSSITITNKTCKQCGFVVADLKEIEKYRNEVKTLISLNKYSEAEKLLNKLVRLYNLEEEKDELKKISLKKNEEIVEIKKIEDLINKKFYIEANQKLIKYIEQYNTNNNIKKLEKEINDILNKVKSLSNEMEKYKQLKNYNLVIEKYEKIVSLVKDYKNMDKLLETLPLVVDNVSYNKIANNLKIKWDFSLSGFSYLIVKKENSAPLNYNDGKIIANVNNLEIIDTDFEEGKIIYYSIFLVKNNIKFIKGKILGPIFIPKPIKNITIKGLDSKIELKWEIPEYCEEIEIYKKQTNNKFKKTEAKKIVINSDFYIDNDVKNNLSYGYMFIVKYKEPITNKTILSEETFYFSTPTSLPKALEKYEYKIENKKLFITFNKVKENISFLLLKEEPKLFFKEIIDINSIKEYKIYNSNGNGIQIPLELQGSIYIVPLSINNSIGVVGKIEKLNFIEDVKNIKTKYQDNKIYIYFTPPIGAKEFLLTYDYNGFIDNHNNTTNKQNYSIEKYNSNGGYLVLDVNNKTQHYLTLYVYDKKNNIVSKGVQFLENCGEKIIIKYKIEKIKKFFLFGDFKDIFIKLQTDIITNFELDEIIIVFKKENVPLSKEDGISIRKMKKVKFKNGIAKIPIPKKYWNTKGYVKLFFVNIDNSKNIRLLPPKEDLIKL
jgi:predicted RNA-binding Zn-ribbon protein involved in translation (DUF1610 family)